MDYSKVRITKKITVWGIVQGVGFRPLVFRLAQKHHILGSVRNLGGMVEIIAQANFQEYESFLEELKSNSGKGYEIVWLEVNDLEDTVDFTEFQIEESGSNDECVILPPDLPVCPVCQAELETKEDRRYHNPFISCMSCGPRYTIMEKVPYDRQNTTMREFEMCEQCEAEYTSPKSRRFHAQTISCNDCGPYLIYQGGKRKLEFINHDALEETISMIQAGGIVAVKGIGGYHLVCSPYLEETVENLRKLKSREEKPFAVMFETIESIEEYCLVSKEEQEVLESKARPIVLLAWKKHKNIEMNQNSVEMNQKNVARNQNNATMNQNNVEMNQNKEEMNQKGVCWNKGNKSIIAPSTYKGSIHCGAFLPYTPLQILLIKRCGPLIMTSANLSNQPIIKDDSIMLSIPSPYLDGVLYNHRRIVRSVDDSVVKMVDHKPQIIRRSRGYVPYPVFLPQASHKKQVLAMGGDLKAAFCLYKKGTAVVSQYFGDLEEGTVFGKYQNSISDLSGFLKMKLDLVVCDLHPNYHSTNYAKTLGFPLLQVQHHHAHIAAVIAEHKIKEPVIGIAFDGTGYGTDGNVWGSEFLLCEGANYQRMAHLNYTPMLGGDQGMRDAKKTATCFLISHDLSEYCNDNRQGTIEAAIKNKINTIQSSSMGRLFDAVASLLGIQEENQYEGQCAIMLEKAAIMALRSEGSEEADYIVEVSNINELGNENLNLSKEQALLNNLAFSLVQEGEMLLIDSKPVLESICKLRHKVSVNTLALGFHYALADVIVTICETIRQNHGVNTIALGGGVFQNTLLLERVLKLLRNQGFEVYYNQVVPPNDGSISLGQAYLGQMMR